MQLLESIKSLIQQGIATFSADKPDTQILFGHYSDNNKSLTRAAKWHEAEAQFADKKYVSCVELFLQYLTDDAVKNVSYQREGNNIKFEIIQGSKKIIGTCDTMGITAYCKLAKTNNNSLAIMRKLLEINFALNFCRYALKDNIIYITIDAALDTCNPNKLYYGLRELALEADKQDDLLMADFDNVETIDADHAIIASQQEQDVKYKYFKLWIEEALVCTADLNQDTFSGGISFVQLNLLQKLDYLLSPQGKLLYQIDKISAHYWNNSEDKPITEINSNIREKLEKLLLWPKEYIVKNFYQAPATYCRVAPPDIAKVQEIMLNSLNNVLYYKDNNYTAIALNVLQYPCTNAAYVNSMPAPYIEYFALFMRINYFDYYTELGFKKIYYNATKNSFQIAAIKKTVDEITMRHVEKYPYLRFNTDALTYKNLVEFDLKYLQILQKLNFTIADKNN
jgi:hypothetical protein